MKKLAIILTLLLTVLTISSQTIVVKTNNVATSFGENYNHDPWGDWTESNLLIFIDLSKEIITINNGFDDKFYITNSSEDEETGKDKDGDTCSSFPVSSSSLEFVM